MHLRPFTSRILALACLGCASYACGSSTPPPETVSPAPAPLPTPSAAAPTATTSAAPTAAPAPTQVVPAGPPAWENPGLLQSYQQLLDVKDRSKDDKALDAGRKPAALMAFAGIIPGMKVAELAAGGGYTAEVLARTVGPFGKVYGQNSKFLLDRFAQAPWTARLKKDVMKNVVRLDREFEAALPPDVTGLDAVFMVLFYHDMVWQNVDRAQMNANVFAALKPGGSFIIVDHSAAPGAGATVTETLHRIEESVVTAELQAAGFQLAATADFLKNPGDSRDWSASPSKAGAKRGTSDRFVLKFIKPTP